MKKKRKKPFRATLASKRILEADGWLVADVESRIPHTFITRDLWGFADLIACRPRTRQIVLIQVTGGTNSSNANARIEKIRQEPNAAICLLSGFEIAVHHWQAVKGQKQREIREWVIFRGESGLEALEI